MVRVTSILPFCNQFNGHFTFVSQGFKGRKIQKVLSGSLTTLMIRGYLNSFITNLSFAKVSDAEIHRGLQPFGVEQFAIKEIPRATEFPRDG